MEIQWPLILFTTFLAWAAGLFATQAIYAWEGKASKAQMPALVTSVILLVIGGVSVMFHLQHWERIFNGFGHITSGITQELIMVVVMIVMMIIYFIFLRRCTDENGKTKMPAPVMVFSLIVAALLVIVMGNSYMMASRPAWDTVFQICSLLGAACGLGPATMAFIVAIRGEKTDIEGPSNLYGQIINAVFSVAYIIAMVVATGQFTQVAHWFDPTSPTKDIAATLNPFMGTCLPMTIAIIVLVIVGIICAVVARKGGNWKIWGCVLALIVVASAICMRVLLYMMGGTVYPFFA